MSGHSKWATIKHQKGVADARRGQLFTKLARAITVAAKDGEDSDSNFKLRLAMDKAREANMPKENIKRAIEKGSGSGGGGELTEVIYEGYGQEKVAVMVEVVTDNKNRTVSELKKIFEMSGGNLGEPGSVAFQFKRKGRIEVEGGGEAEMLKLIDLGGEEVEPVEGGLEVAVEAEKLTESKGRIEAAGFKVKLAELIYAPLSLLPVEDKVKERVKGFLAKLVDHDDVQNVYTNADL